MNRVAQSIITRKQMLDQGLRPPEYSLAEVVVDVAPVADIIRNRDFIAAAFLQLCVHFYELPPD